MLERGSERRQRARMKSCGLLGRDIHDTGSSFAAPFTLLGGAMRGEGRRGCGRSFEICPSSHFRRPKGTGRMYVYVHRCPTKNNRKSKALAGGAPADDRRQGSIRCIGRGNNNNLNHDNLNSNSLNLPFGAETSPLVYLVRVVDLRKFILDRLWYQIASTEVRLGRLC